MTYEAEAIAIRENDCWVLIAICPYCEKRTSHGGGPPEKPPNYSFRYCHNCQLGIELIPIKSEGKSMIE